MGEVWTPLGAFVLAAVTAAIWGVVRTRRSLRVCVRESLRPPRPSQGPDEHPSASKQASWLIQLDAAASARKAYAAGDSNPVNPHPKNTSQYVLWITTWFLVWDELAEADAPSSAGGGRHAD